MNSTSDWHGRTLQASLNEQPGLSLDFYSYGLMLRKRESDAVTEYAVDPAQVAVWRWRVVPQLHRPQASRSPARAWVSRPTTPQPPSGATTLWEI